MVGGHKPIVWLIIGLLVWGINSSMEIVHILLLPHSAQRKDLYYPCKGSKDGPKSGIIFISVPAYKLLLIPYKLLLNPAGPPI